MKKSSLAPVEIIYRQSLALESIIEEIHLLKVALSDHAQRIFQNHPIFTKSCGSMIYIP